MLPLSFQEYINAKGKLVDAQTSDNGDNVTPNTSPKTPPQGGKPYAATGGGKCCDKPLGDHGEDITDMPKISNKKVELGHAMKSEDVAAIYKAVKTLKENINALQPFVYHLQNEGLLGAFIGQALTLRETYQHISECMAHAVHGPVVCGKLVKAMNEDVSAPFSSQLAGDEEETGPDDSIEDDQSDDLDTDDLDSDLGDEDEYVDLDSDDSEGMDLEDDEDGEPSPEAVPPAMNNFQQAMNRF